VATKDARSIGFRADLDRLAQQVQLWFRQATNRFEPPSETSCRTVAFYLLFAPSPRSRRTPDAREKAVKHGKQFLRNIELERQQMEHEIALAADGQPLGNWVEEYQQMLCRIDETQRHIRALIRFLSQREASPDPIRKIALVAQDAWAAANMGWMLSAISKALRMV
jgi:hypothetical protein